MGTISKPNTFSAGSLIVASEHNANFDTIYNEFNGNITNANIDAAAAIADTKLATISSSGKVDFAALTVSGQTQGDVMYHNGTAWVRLSTGTNGQLLESGGAAANPAWTTLAGDASGTVDGNTVTDLTLTSEAQGTIAYFNGSNWVILAVGTADQFLQTKGAAANPVWADSVGGFTNMEAFTSGGTWTRPAGVDTVWVRVWAGGGNGSSGNDGNDEAGSGGGGGAYAEDYAAVSGNVTVTVGSAGGTSSFGAFASAGGGSNASGVTGGAGGSATAGDLQLSGGPGGDGVDGDAGASGAFGGSSPFGGAGGPGGGGQAGSTDAGETGTVPGGGGGGGNERGGAGGAGAAGLVIVYWSQ